MILYFSLNMVIFSSDGNRQNILKLNNQFSDEHNILFL